MYQNRHTDPFLKKSFFKFEIRYKKINIPCVVTVGHAILIPIILLPIMIVSNYEGDIKTLGWVMIGYTIASITAGLVADYIVPIAAFLIIFLIDIFYYRYLKDTLTKI